MSPLHLLALGCGNVANLLLVRGIRRLRDSAVRLAIGASRARLLRLHLMESSLLAIGGAAAGVGLALSLKQFIQTLILPGRPPDVALPDVPLDTSVLGLTLVSAVVCGLVAGIAPAWMASSPRLVRVLGQADARATRRGTKLRTALAAGQLALSLMLLTGALLMVETLRQLRAIDLGFDATGVSAHHLNLAEHGYTRTQATDYYDGLLQRIHAIPGVTAASVSDGAPFGPSNIRRLRLPEGTDADAVRAVGNGIGDEYVDVLRIR